VAILNLMFGSFDTLTTRHKVYKVETIGDAYLACTGVVPVKKEVIGSDGEEYENSVTSNLCDWALAAQDAMTLIHTPVILLILVPSIICYPSIILTNTRLIICIGWYTIAYPCWYSYWSSGSWCSWS
jgi:hypothetical protein